MIPRRTALAMALAVLSASPASAMCAFWDAKTGESWNAPETYKDGQAICDYAIGKALHDAEAQRAIQSQEWPGDQIGPQIYRFMP